jgi:RHS repeat-associated protein
VAGDASQHNAFRFSTKYMTTENGLYYYGHRYYSPQRARWGSRDPLAGAPHADAHSLSGDYAFVGNDPARRLNASGLVSPFAATPIAVITNTVQSLGGSACSCPLRFGYRTFLTNVEPYGPGQTCHATRVPLWWGVPPPNEHQPCCCRPAAVGRLIRVDRVYRWGIKAKLRGRLRGCCSNMEILWWTCARRPSLTSSRRYKGAIPRCYNRTACRIGAWAGDRVTWLTAVHVRFQTCLNWRCSTVWCSIHMNYRARRFRWVPDPLSPPWADCDFAWSPYGAAACPSCPPP